MGLTVPCSAAAVRAGVAGFAEHPEMVDEEGEPFIVARCPELAADVTGPNGFGASDRRPLEETLAPLAELKGRGRPIPAVIGLPAPRPGLPQALGEAWPSGSGR